MSETQEEVKDCYCLTPKYMGKSEAVIFMLVPRENSKRRP